MKMRLSFASSCWWLSKTSDSRVPADMWHQCIIALKQKITLLMDVNKCPKALQCSLSLGETAQLPGWFGGSSRGASVDNFWKETCNSLHSSENDNEQVASWPQSDLIFSGLNNNEAPRQGWILNWITWGVTLKQESWNGWMGGWEVLTPNDCCVL